MLSTPLSSLPCCYFTTKTVVIDDDEIFIDTLSHYISIHNNTFTNPKHALEVLLKYHPHVDENLWVETNLQTDHTDRINGQALTVNLIKMKNIFLNTLRRDDISVLVVDYKMPEIDGLAILSELKSKPFKKILLTGKGDHALAVKAFNEGLIDYFLPKSDENLLANLKDAIKNLRASYFFNLTKRLHDHSPFISRISADENFKNYFLKILDTLKISEFYLNDFTGAYVLLSNDKKYYFIVYPYKELINLANIAEQDGAPKKTVTEIRSHLKIPFFGQDKNFWEIPGSEWNSYLYPANLINSTKGKLYCSIIEEHKQQD